MTDPQAKLDVGGSAGNPPTKSLQLRSGDIHSDTSSIQIIFSYDGNSYDNPGGGYGHSIRTRHHSSQSGSNAIDFYTWTPADDIDALGTNRVMTIDGTGRVGIGTITPSASLDVDGGLIADTEVETIFSTTTLVAADRGKTFLCSDGTGFNINLPDTSTAGFVVGTVFTFIQTGTGQITFVGSGATLLNRRSHTKTAGQWAAVSVIVAFDNNYLLAGDTAL